MAYKTLYASPGGKLYANCKAIADEVDTQLKAMGWESVDDSGLPTVKDYSNTVASTAITTGNPGTITLNGHGFIEDQPVIFTTSGTRPVGLTPTQSCAPAAVTNDGGGHINVHIAGHGFVYTQAVFYASTANAIGNLTNGKVFYICNATADDFGLSETPGGGSIGYSSSGTGTHYFGSIYYICNPLANTFQLSLTPAGGAIAISSQGTGNHSFGNAEPNTDWYLHPGHGFLVGQNPQYQAGTTAIGGLNSNYIWNSSIPFVIGYMIYEKTGDAFRLCAPYPSSPLVNLTNIGVGWHTFGQVYRIYKSPGEPSDYAGCPNIPQYLLVQWQSASAGYLYFTSVYYWDSTSHCAFGPNYIWPGLHYVVTTEVNTTYLWIWGCKTWVAFCTRIGSSYSLAGMGFTKKLFSNQTATTAPVTAGASKIVTVDDASKLHPGKYYQIMGASGEGRDRIQITARNLGANTVTIANVPRNYGTKAIIGETPASGIWIYFPTNSAYQDCNPPAVVGQAQGGGTNSQLSGIMSNAYVLSDGRYENKSILLPWILVNAFNPWGVGGYLDDYYLYGPPQTASLNNEDTFGVDAQDLTGANKGRYTGTSSGANDGTHFNDTRTYDGGDTINWTADQWAGFELLITGGTGAGQTRKIASNGVTQLVLETAFTTIPDATSTYQICVEAWRYINPWCMKENL
jgi:hypothetical protein